MTSKFVFSILFISNLAFASLNGSGGGGGFGTANWRFSLGGGYGLTYKMRFDSASYPVVGSGRAEFDHETALSLEADARSLPIMSWGFIAALSIDTPRKMTSGTFTQSSGAAFGYSTVDVPKLQTTALLINAAYRMNEFYVPFGLNYAVFKYTPRSSFGGSATAMGGIGAQFGAGIYATENVLIEYIYQLTAYKHSLDYGGGIVEDYGSGFITSTFLKVKYLF